MAPESKTKAGQRRLAREIALSILFQHEAGEQLPPEEGFDLFCKNFGPIGDEERVLGCDDPIFEKVIPYVKDIFFGVTKHQKELDRLLNRASRNWRLDRMSRVDRNVMRLALYEMLFREDIPFKVSINEAIDLGKHFGAEDSGAFINGVLDRVHHMILEGRIDTAVKKKGTP